MNALEGASQAIVLAQQTILLLRKLLALAAKYQRTLGQPRFSYENLSLDFTLDLPDTSGERAYIKRRQRVRFLTEASGVLRSPMWGEGNQLKRFASQGARRVGSLREGSREVVLLALNQPANKGDVIEVRSDETLEHAFEARNEYFEASVERPTQRLRIQVVFPAGRAPKQAYVDLGSRPGKRLPVRIGRDGRARLHWSAERPRLDSLFSLRWSW